MRICFRVDAGPSVGLGHLQRCLSLATALRAAGVDSVVAGQLADDAVARVSAAGAEVVRLDAVVPPWSLAEVEWLCARAAASGCRGVVVDGYGAGPSYFEQLRRAGFWVGAIDDLAACPLPCQLVINGGAHGAQLRYVSSTGETEFLLGPSYALLAQPYWAAGPRARHRAAFPRHPAPRGPRLGQPARNGSGGPDHVLVTLGGSDQGSLLAALLSALDARPEPFEVTAVIGPFMANTADLRRIASAGRHRIALVEHAPVLRPWMEQATVTVTAGGQTLYELARVGCPAVAIEVAPNQRPQMSALAAAGVIDDAGRAQEPGVVARAVAGAMALLKDPVRREAMARAGQQLVDGQGPARVAAVVAKHLGAKAPVG